MQAVVAALRLCVLYALFISSTGLISTTPSRLGLLGECRRDAIQACNSNCGSHLEAVTRSQLDACYTFENEILIADFLRCESAKSMKEPPSCLFLNASYTDSWRRASASDRHYFSCMEACVMQKFAKCTELGCDQRIDSSGNAYKCFQSANAEMTRHFFLCIRDIWSSDLTEEMSVQSLHRPKRSDTNSSVSHYKRYNVLKKIPQDQLRVKTRASRPDNRPLKQFVDWRKATGRSGAHVLSPVKDQIKCGSCWAFASAAVLEAHLVLVDNHIENGGAGNISAQEFVDCVNKWKGLDNIKDQTCAEESYKGEDNGCCGGNAWDAWEFSRKVGVVWDANYKYTGTYSPCKWEKLNDTSMAFRPLHDQNDTHAHVLGEEEMMRAVAFEGPIVATVNGNCLPDPNDETNSYRKILNNEENTDEDGRPCDWASPNHAIVIVGYGTTADKGVPYWIIRNSWGTKWGQDGYYRIKRGTKELGIEVEGGFYPLLMKKQTLA